MKSRRSSHLAACLLLSLTAARAGWVPVSALDSPVVQNGNRFGVDLLLEGDTLVAGEQEKGGGGQWSHARASAWLRAVLQKFFGRVLSAQCSGRGVLTDDEINGCEAAVGGGHPRRPIA
jgi:hypothetical protein